MSSGEVAVITRYYKPCTGAELSALLSIVNPDSGSPFMHWLWTNADDIQARIAAAPPHVLAFRLLDRARLEGPGTDMALQAIYETKGR